MGSISDCCVAVDSKELRTDNEGVTNMDTTAMHTYLSTNDKRNNPSIYSKIPESDSSYQSNESHDTDSDNEDSDNESEQDIETESKPTEIHSEASTSPEPQTESYKNGTSKTIKTDTQNYLKIGANDPKLKQKQDIISEPQMRHNKHNSSTDNLKIRAKNNKKIQWRIVVTQPLSPIKKLQNIGGAYETDTHPYSKHKQKQKLLCNGYIRRYNITSITVLPNMIINFIFEFYYFHFADYNSQQSVLNDKNKEKKSIKLIIGKSKNEENLSQFLETVLNSKLSEKMWNKFDIDLKGAVETDKFTQFLILPVILYKSTLFHRHKKENKNNNGKQNNKPNLDKKQIKQDVEHLAVWIICNFGQKQVDNSFHFRLTKYLYQNELAHFIAEYIRIHNVQNV